MTPDYKRSMVLAAVMILSSIGAGQLQPSRAEVELQALDLAAIIPSQFGDWKEDTSIAPIQATANAALLTEKIYDSLLSRSYVDSNGNLMMLMVAYGSDQTGRLRLHRPESCYAAQGFSVSVEDVSPVLGGTSIPVKRLVAARGSRSEPITYWLRVGGENVKSLWGQRLEQLRYGLTGSIPDGVLFRVSSISGNAPEAYAMQDRFVHDLFAAVPKQDRGHLVADWPDSP